MSSEKPYYTASQGLRAGLMEERGHWDRTPTLLTTRRTSPSGVHRPGAVHAAGHPLLAMAGATDAGKDGAVLSSAAATAVSGHTGWGLVRHALAASWWVWLFAAALGVALATRSLVWLDYVHVMSAILWTGADLFTGFVVEPALRRLDMAARRRVVTHVTPYMLLSLPVLATTTVTAGWFLARWVGVYRIPSMHGWFVLAMVLALVLFAQGGILLPLQLRVFLAFQQEHPDTGRIERALAVYTRLMAWQSLLQLGTVFVMVHFVI